MAGKWEFHGRKVGETRLGTQTEINNNKNVKVFHITTEIRGGSEGRQAMTMMTDDSVNFGGTAVCLCCFLDSSQKSIDCILFYVNI